MCPLCEDGWIKLDDGSTIECPQCNYIVPCGDPMPPEANLMVGLLLFTIGLQVLMWVVGLGHRYFGWFSG